MRTTAPAFVLIAMAQPALANSAASVNAEQFYLTARELEAKGMTALFDSRSKPMQQQMKDAGDYARAANASATKSGKPLYCVPEAARKKGLNVERVLAILEKLGTSRRKAMTLDRAWLAALRGEYPCS